MFTAIYSYLIKDNHYISFFGLIFFLLIAVIFSKNKRKINLKHAVFALGMQIVLAFFVLKTEIGFSLFSAIARGFKKLYSFTDAGISFVFGNLINANGPWGVIFAVKVTPIVIFFAAFMSMLYYLKVIQLFIKIVSYVIRPALGTSGAETLCAAANSMLGPTEAPLLVKKFLNTMTESELFVVMVSGFATMSAAIMAVYSAIGVSMIHMLTAAVMSIPGALLISKIMIPETENPETLSCKTLDIKSDANNLIDAVASGTMDGLNLATSVVAMLIAFVSLMAMFDYILVYITGYNLNFFFAKLFSAVAFLLGIDSKDTFAAGSLLGQKLVINEFVAFMSFVKTTLTDRSAAILTYALAGFANISVIGILIAGVGSLAPDKRKVLTNLGWKALLGGTIVNLLNAAIAALLL